MTVIKFTISIVSVGALLSGCVNLDYPLSTVDGVASSKNFVAQVVDPEPAEGAPLLDAGQADAAVQRYRDGEVKTAESDDEAGLQLNLGPAQ